MLAVMVAGLTVALSGTAPAPCVSGGRAWGAGTLTLRPDETASTAGGVSLSFNKSAVLQVVGPTGTALWTMPASAWMHNPCNDPLCATDTSGKCIATFQGDGNFVVHNTHGGCADTSTWDDNTGSFELLPHPPYFQIFDAGCAVLWWSSPGNPPPGPKATEVKYLPGRMRGPLVCTIVDPVTCPGSIALKGVALVLTAKGNIQINDTTTPGTVLWSANTRCTTGNCTLDLDGDGNVVLHEWHVGKSTPSTAWASWTYNENNGYLVFKNTVPYLEFFDQHGTLIWTNLGVVAFNQSVLGGVITRGDAAAAAALHVTAANVVNDADGEVKWAVYDYHNRLVKSGAAVANGSNVAVIPLKPDPELKGYFDVVVGGFNTSYAVVEDNGWAFSQGHPFGVGTHFSQGVSPDLMPLIVKLGAKAIRDNGGAWAGVEKVRGVYNFTLSPVYQVAHRLDLEPTFVLAFGNPIYMGGKGDRIAPYNATGYKAYADFVLKTVEEYPWVKRFEVWNEYIGSFVDSTSPAASNKPYFYTQMIAEVNKVVKPAHPDVLLGGGAAEDIPMPSFDKEFALGMCKYSDGIIIHPYTYAEGVERKLATLQDHIKAANGGQPLAIWATEWSSQEPDTAVGRRQDANYAARMAILMHMAGVDRMHWFLMSDFQSWPRGFVRGDDKKNRWGRFAVTPGFTTYSAVIHFLAGTTFHARLTRATSSAYIVRFTNATYSVTVCWAAQPNATVSIEIGAAKAYSVEGVPIAPPFEDGQPFVLPSDPFYLVGAVGAVKDLEPVPLTDSRFDFSFSQGVNGYTYGEYPNSALAVNASVDTSSFSEMTVYSNDTWMYYWVGSQPECRLYAEGAVPGNHTSPARRWVANTTGAVELLGVLGKPNSGGLPISGVIFKNGGFVTNMTVDPGSGGSANDFGETFAVRLDVTAGDKLDFVLMGDGAGSTYPIDDHSTFRFDVFPQ